MKKNESQQVRESLDPNNRSRMNFTYKGKKIIMAQILVLLLINNVILGKMPNFSETNIIDTSHGCRICNTITAH